ncbi:MAG: FliH/SctL family protein [Pseudomonadota bacterium]
MTNMSEVADTRWQAPSFPAPESIPTAGELEQLQQQIYDETYQQAHKEGYEAGMSEALQTGRKELAERSALLSQALDALAAPLEQLEDELEAQLLQMVSRLVGRLFRRQLELEPDSIIGLVRDAVDKLPSATRNIEVRVHPEDAERLAAIVSASNAPDTGEQRWALVSDPALTRGGCHITSHASEVDARVETRIESMVNELVGDQRSE